jgi:hypothetical protein
LIKHIAFISLTFLLIFSSLSCGGIFNKNHGEFSTKLINGKPQWYWKPSDGEKTGGVGISGMHVSGKNAQRELTVQRAIDDIARQMGVRVSSISQTRTSGSSEGATTQMDTYSIHTVTGETIKAKINEFWLDNQTDELYVWMVVQ